MAARQPVVVGIDGTEESKAAIKWAIDEARSRAVPLRMVYVLETLVRSEFEWRPAYNVPGIRNPAEEMMLTELADAKLIANGVEVTGEVRPGFRIDMLAEESQKATLLVLGSRGFGLIRSLVGSTSCGVAAKAVSPVVVVRRRAAEPDGPAPVVVGVDGTGRSPHVLGFAFDYADRRSLPVRAVLGSSRLRLPGRGAGNGSRARQRLAELLDGWRTAYPDVEVEPIADEGRPVDVLVAHARDADLLVVGAHGKHAIVDTLRGSVSQGILHHAPCPVAVLHPPP